MEKDSAAGKVAWRRVDIPGVNISVDLHPGWPVLEGERLVYQRFSNEGAVSVHWGEGATIEQVFAHAGLGSGGSSRTTEVDQPTTVDGRPARRVRFRVSGPDAIASGAHPPPGDPERVYVFVAFSVDGTPVLSGYRSPSSELAAFEPLLEHILASVKRR